MLTRRFNTNDDRCQAELHAFFNPAIGMGNKKKIAMLFPEYATR